VKLGTEVPIAGIYNNPGTFQEDGLTGYANIMDYHSDPNGTSVYDDSHGGISLTPLGGEQAVTYNSYTFAGEGDFGVTLSIPMGNDDKPNNNLKTVWVGADGTAPVTTYTVSPASPNGNNGWYVTNVQFTLKATDPALPGPGSFPGSGVGSIYYSIDGGAAVPYSNTVTISTDGNHTIGYYAVDKVGNQETQKTFAVHVDKTAPWVVLNKDILINKIRYTAICQDNTSLLDRVEFWIGPYLQFTQTFSDPSGQQSAIWVMSPISNINVTIEARCFDLAGNQASGWAGALDQNLAGQSQPAHEQTK